MRQRSCRKPSTKPHLKSIRLSRLSVAMDQGSLCQTAQLPPTSEIPSSAFSPSPAHPKPGWDMFAQRQVVLPRGRSADQRALVPRILLLLCRRETTSIETASITTVHYHQRSPSLVLHASVSVDTWTMCHLIRERDVYTFSEISVITSEGLWP